MRFPLVRDRSVSIDYWAHMHTRVWNRPAHTRLAQRDPISYSGNMSLTCWEMYKCVGSWIYTFNNVFIHSHEYRAASSPYGTQQGDYCSFSLFLSSLHLPTHLSDTLLGRQPLLFTFNFSPWILIAHCVFPGSVIRITISASDSAAATSKQSELFFVFFSSWALLLSVGGVCIAGFAFRK